MQSGEAFPGEEEGPENSPHGAENTSKEGKGGSEEGDRQASEKAQVCVALVEIPPLLSYSLPVPGRVGFHCGREVVTALAPTSQTITGRTASIHCAVNSSSYWERGSGCGRWPQHGEERSAQGS